MGKSVFFHKKMIKLFHRKYWSMYWKRRTISESSSHDSSIPAGVCHTSVTYGNWWRR